MTDEILKPLTHVGPFPIDIARRIIARGFDRGWLRKGDAPAMQPGESTYGFQRRVSWREQKADNTVDNPAAGN